MQWPTVAPSDLSDVVVCLWSAEMAAGERLVPDGCVDLVWIPEHGRLWVCGPERTAWISPTPAGTKAVGARLRPGSAPRLLRTDANDLADRRVELPAVLPGRQGRVALERFAESVDPLAVLVDEIRRLRDRADPPSASDEHIVRSATQRTTRRVRDLADEVGLTSRQLHRRSERLFGYGLSVLTRLIRFQRFLHLARNHPELRSAAWRHWRATRINRISTTTAGPSPAPRRPSCWPTASPPSRRRCPIRTRHRVRMSVLWCHD